MSSLSVGTLAATIVPVLFVLVLGYTAGRRHRFDPDQAAGLSRLALDFALPAALLVSMLRLQRSQIVNDWPVLVGVLISYVVVFWAVFLMLRRRPDWGDDGAAIAALLVTFPAAPVFGQAVLTPLFEARGAETTGMIALVSNLALTPVTLVILARTAAAADSTAGVRTAKSATAAASATTKAGSSAPGSGSAASAGAPAAPPVLRIVAKALSNPLVIAPLVGVIAALAGLPQSALLDSTLDLLGTASSGAAIFAAGLVLAAHRITVDRDVVGLVVIKMIVVPAILFALLLVLPQSQIAEPALVGTALPSAVVSVLLPTTRTKVRARAATVLFVTCIAMVVILPLSVLVSRAL